MAQPQRDDRIGLVWVAALGAIVVYHVAAALSAGSVFSDGTFVDSDVYMWMVRAEHLAGSQGWFDHLNARVDPPAGHAQHWTRPLDALLIAGGTLLGVVWGFRDGLALWANLISPLLHLLVLWPVWRLARTVLAPRPAAFTTGAFALHGATFAAFQWGRADHHSLLIVGQAVFLLGLARLFVDDHHRLRTALWTGLVGAVALWVNVEAMAYVLVALVALGIYWLWGRRDLLREAVTLSAGLTVGLILATLLEHGPRALEPFPIDTVGLPYVVLFALTTAFWGFLWLVDEQLGEPLGLGGRLVAGTVGAAGVLGALGLFHPQFFAGPFHLVDPLYRELRLTKLDEQQPLLRFGVHSVWELLGYGLEKLGIVIAALWVTVRRLRARPDASSAWVWGIFGAMALVFAALSLRQIRWIYYMPLGAALGYGVFAAWLQDEAEARLGNRLVRLARPVVVVAALLLPAVAGLVFLAAAPAEPPPEAAITVVRDGKQQRATLTGGCDLREASRWLDDASRFEPPAIILANPDVGSELLYRTDHAVLTIANHRPQPGFALFVETFRAVDAAAAARRLRRRGVDALLVCPTSDWVRSFGRDDPDGLAQRLAAGRPVASFETLADPSQAGGWWIYRPQGVSP